MQSHVLEPVALMERAVREALEAVVAIELGDRILSSALSRDGRVRVPEEINDARKFFRSALRRTLLEHTSPFVADAVMTSLAESMDVAESRVLSKLPHGESPAPAPERFVILVASRNPQVMVGLAKEAPSEIDVYPVADIYHLIGALDASKGKQPVIVIDCASEVVDPRAIMNLSPVLPRGSCVLLWGADARLRDEWTSVGDRGRYCLPCPDNASLEDVSQMVLDVINPGASLT